MHVRRFRNSFVHLIASDQTRRFAAIQDEDSKARKEKREQAKKKRYASRPPVKEIIRCAA